MRIPTDQQKTLAVLSGALLILFAPLAQANNLVLHDLPSWLKPRLAEKTVERIERHLEWDLRKINVWFYSDSAEFKKQHGYSSTDVTVTAFTRPQDQSVHMGPAITIDNFERVFGHELVHVMLQQKYKKSVPKWLEEGLANHFGQKGAPASQKLKIDYAWVLAQTGSRDVRELVHPFKTTGQDRARYHYQASTALAELIQSKCDLEQLLQLSVGKSLENFLPTLCEIKDLNGEFQSFLKRKSALKSANQKL